jgi:hypothetical protein
MTTNEDRVVTSSPETSVSQPETSLPSIPETEHSQKINDVVVNSFAPEGLQNRLSEPSNESELKYTREELLALFKIDYPLPKDFIFHEMITSKEPFKPIALTPVEEQEEVNVKNIHFFIPVFSRYLFLNVFFFKFLEKIRLC